MAVLSCQVLGADVKVSAYGVWQGDSSLHIKFWDTLFVSETIRARKLKFGMLVGICMYYSSMSKYVP